MSLWDRLWGRRKESRRARDARAQERSGDLHGAVEAFLDADLPDEAARVLLMRANAEPSPDKRMAFCAEAARVAEDPELATAAHRRKALLAFDLLQARGSGLPSELVAAGRDLEEAGEHERAADAFALAGDKDGEVRALTAAGAIERLESRLAEAQSETRRDQELSLLLRRLEDLDRTAERRAALSLAQRFLEDRVEDRVSDAARAIRARVLRGPLCTLEIGGRQETYALGDEVTIGRGEATIVVASRAISREHLRVYRGPGGVMVEDLRTRNGTLLSGARLGAPLPVGEGLDLRLGGEVPCKVTPAGAGVAIEVAGETLLAPLGPISVGDLAVTLVGRGADDESFVVLTSRADGRPFMGDYHLGRRVELSAGDEIRALREGPVVLVAVADGAIGAGR